ncbi:Crp/Fnr family transcriptional regulator [Desulfosporosinus sp. Sb-LF]|uniref:Crp/Fnr family transcriptional regulator n=1 Tax=Desulfosporosinus sp. Sb-LF TaxID=2560027 RepID=UPI00107FC327|nr:Crp/Fnr family transcriptional regulator [Desulfosporosinus sp. Sb-LF]TGE30934.1 Crp/Fnr family transcriptional regulator [Desulfosporosinus sp. Sb-LF]
MEIINYDALALDESEKNVVREYGIAVHYPKGQIVFSAGDTADRVYLIEEGFVKIYRITMDGRKVTVGSMRSPGQLMGLAETLYHGERTCFAGAINDSTLIVVRKSQFEELMAQHPTIALKVATTLGVRMREAEAIIQEMVSWQVPGRLAMLLLKMSERTGIETETGTKITLRLTHEEIACMIGTSRQTVTSLLNIFKQESSIAIEEREMYILDTDKLKKWIV